MKFNIILPFNRYQNKAKILHFLKLVSDKILLHIIEEKHNESIWEQHYIKTLVCPTISKDFDTFYYKLNFFIQNVDIIDDEYYMVFSDHNLFDLDIIYQQLVV